MLFNYNFGFSETDFKVVYDIINSFRIDSRKSITLKNGSSLNVYSKFPDYYDINGADIVVVDGLFYYRLNFNTMNLLNFMVNGSVGKVILLDDIDNIETVIKQQYCSDIHYQFSSSLRVNKKSMEDIKNINHYIRKMKLDKLFE